MPKRQNDSEIIGHKFGNLTIKSVHRGEKYPKAACLCDCGSEYIGRLAHIKSGAVISCGCIKKSRIGIDSTTHGHTKNRRPSPTYTCWAMMIARCYKPYAKSYERYGGRGISVCDKWRESFENFLADMGERPSGLQIERINNDGNYEPGNCRWATRTEQARNKRNNRIVEYLGEKMTLAELAERQGMPARKLLLRIRRGWTVEQAATAPNRVNQHG